MLFGVMNSGNNMSFPFEFDIRKPGDLLLPLEEKWRIMEIYIVKEISSFFYSNNPQFSRSRNAYSEEYDS